MGNGRPIDTPFSGALRKVWPAIYPDIGPSVTGLETRDRNRKSSQESSPGRYIWLFCRFAAGTKSSYDPNAGGELLAGGTTDLTARPGGLKATWPRAGEKARIPTR